MAFVTDDFANALLASTASCTPGNFTALSNAMRAYLSTGSPVSGAVSLAPLSGAGWLALAGASVATPATADGFKTAIQVELAGTTVSIPPTTRPAVWNASAKFPDLSGEKTAKDVWVKIAQYIIDYVSTELK